MSTINQILTEIQQLERPSQWELFQRWLLQDATITEPVLIEKTQDICGGVARIVRTRIPVWVIEELRRQGADEAEIMQSFPTLNKMDVLAAWYYAAQHPAEIEQQIHKNSAA